MVSDIWNEMNTDGNTHVSFPEFVEWASSHGQRFGFPQPVGIIGEKGRAGDYPLPCTVAGCSCTNFCANGRDKLPRNSGAKFCESCGHPMGFHAAMPGDQILAVLPRCWSLHPCNNLKAPVDLVHFAAYNEFCLVPCDSDTISQVQQLMDASAKATWTRDRGRNSSVPSGYEVVRVDRNENVKAWLKYYLQKALIVEALMDAPIPQYRMRTSQLVQTLPMMDLTRPDEAVNEWYLWHGSSSKGAVRIAETEFKQALAGSSTGTLYGHGSYLSDSCTKADEYSKEIVDGKDSGLFCIMLCRVMGGQVRYTDEVAPKAKALMTDVLEGEYDCILGDREKCRGTFKEIVIYQSSQAYPEYLVYYRRKFE